MKTRLTIAAFALIVATLLTATPASAQVASSRHTAQIPFAFHVGDTVLPAGSYSITLTEGRTQLRALDGKTAVVAASIPISTRRDSEVSHLKFDRRGDDVYLTDVYFAGSNQGVELLQNKVQAASRM